MNKFIRTNSYEQNHMNKDSLEIRKKTIINQLIQII